MTIGVFFGSRSPEHDISIITGQLIIAGLKKLGHEVEPVYVTKKGEWFLGKELGEMKVFTSGTIEGGRYGNYYLDLEKSRGRLVFRKKGFAGREIVMDLVFPAFHGASGEDGAFQGMCEMMGVPYVGCGVAASALSMDKILTKTFYKAHHIPTTEFLHYHLNDWKADKKKVLGEITEKLKWPIFVKPPLLGSSIGITKVQNESGLELAIEVALHYGNTFLAEEGVEDLMDVTCCVIGHSEPMASMLQESVMSGELFSYEDKYLKGGGQGKGKSVKNLVIPANLDKILTSEIQQMSVKIFKLIGCSGISRFDFLIDKRENKFFANEINPLPGTLYHHLWAKSGVELPQLLEKLIKFAGEAHTEKNRYQTTFESDVLKMADPAKLKTKKNGA